MNCDYIFSTLFPYWFYLFVFASLLFIVIPLFFYIEKATLTRVLLSFVFLGGLSNFYYRAQYKCVPDYFNFFGWFQFNLADILITGGSLTLIVLLIIKDSMPKID